MKIAFAMVPEKGHINPYIGPAQALADAGHTVVIASPGDIRQQITRAGLMFCPDLIGPASDDRVTRGAALVELIQDGQRLRVWIEQLLLGGLPEAVQSLRDWYRRERADVVVVDPLFYAAVIAAAVEQLPWASLSNSLNPAIPPGLDSALQRTVEHLRPRRTELFQSFGIEMAFNVCDALSPHLTIAFATKALVGEPPAGVTLVGPSRPLHDRGDESRMRPLPTDRPVVYASFGSQIYFWPELFEQLHAAAQQLHAHLVLSIGDLVDDPRWLSPREHCDVYRYAPQLEILRHAAVFITHGGANSVMEAITAGVPMLVSPMCNDQFHQAFFIERAAIGCVEDLPRASLERIVERLGHLLADADIRFNMKKVSATYQVNGAVAAARLIAGLGRGVQ